MRKIRKVFGFSFYILIVLLFALIIKVVAFQRTEVSGTSMESTLHDGDSLIIDKLSYHFIPPKRFDIIVFPCPDEERDYYVKRIVGLPGETVSIREGVLMINSHVLPYRYNSEKILEPGIAADDIELHEGEYFVLGDNVNDSLDSRSPGIGVINISRIMGKVVFRIRPFDKIGVVK